MRIAQREKEILQKVEEKIARGPYEASWASLCEAQMPQWLAKEKLGIFIHWGVYSVPANSNEWYPRNMYKEGMPAYEHHRKTYGLQKNFGYKDFIPMFRAEHFCPAEWMELFQAAGAGYVFPVAEHHDGFQMYRSDLSDWNAVDMGPKRDVLGELKEEAKKRGIHFCTSSHRAEHWFFLGNGKTFDSDIHEPLKKGDFYWPSMPEADPEDLYSRPYPWQTDTAIARNSWCYTDTLIYKTSQEIICTLVDVVSKNGNLLLNVGPKADGTLPEGDKKILRDLADWMAVNREAIHGAKVWRKSSEGPTKMQEGQFSDQKEMVYTPQDYRFTVNHGNIYAIALKCPQDGNFCVQSLAESSDQNLPEFHGIIRQVEVLGYEKSPEWKTDAEGLHVKTSGFYSEFPVVLKIVVS